MACATVPQTTISLSAACRLLEVFAQRSGREDVVLLMAQERRLSNLGALGLITTLQTDLRHALSVVIARRREVNSGLMIALEEHAGIAVLRLQYVVPGAPYSRQANEQATGVIVQLMRQFLGADWMPRRVCFRHPPPVDLRTHRQVLGWAVEFEHDFNAIVLTSQELDTPAPIQDAALANFAQRNMRSNAEQFSMAQACREHLTELLPQGIATIDQVATRMGMQRRTL